MFSNPEIREGDSHVVQESLPCNTIEMIKGFYKPNQFKHCQTI